MRCYLVRDYQSCAIYMGVFRLTQDNLWMIQDNPKMTLGLPKNYLMMTQNDPFQRGPI